MIGHRTYRYTRNTFGTLNFKNLYSHSFGYTETRKKVAAGTATSVLAATSGSTSAVTVTTGITNPDVPRCLSVTPGGTSANIASSAVTITGTNIEGKTITELFVTAPSSTTIINGVKAFKTVTSVVIGAQNGSGTTFSVGTRNILGINHRLFRNNSTVKVYSATAVGGALTLQGVPTITTSEDQIELNTVGPLTAPNSSTFLIMCYMYDNWSLAPVYDEPEYSTSTSTSSTSSSTSTTTGTTTSTSTSSTSTSSTSVSTSSTSSSTSSTSTSTTTVP